MNNKNFFSNISSSFGKWNENRRAQKENARIQKENERIQKSDNRIFAVLDNKQLRQTDNELSALRNGKLASTRIAEQQTRLDDDARGRQNRKLERYGELQQMRNNGAARTGVSANEAALASYLFGRGLTKRAIDGDQLAVLRSGNETLNQTRSKLNKGRGNVDVDVERSGHEHESSRRTKIGRDLVKEVIKDGMPVNRKGQLRASVAEVLRAGNCSEHAHVAANIHANKLSGGQSVHRVGSKITDHAWAELRLHPKGTANDVILDAWAKGPAILREDAKFAHDTTTVSSAYSYNRASGPPAAQLVRANTVSMKGNDALQKRIKSELKTLKRNDYQYKKVFLETGVASDSFKTRVNDAKLKQHPLAQQIVAAGVGRNLGANVAQAKLFADSTVKRKK